MLRVARRARVVRRMSCDLDDLLRFVCGHCWSQLVTGLVEGGS